MANESSPAANRSSAAASNISRIVFVLAAAGFAAAADDCARCHPAQSARHAATRHARALRPLAESEFAQALPDGPIGEARGGYLLSYSPESGGLRVRAERGRDTKDAVFAWAFGAGGQGVTPVGRVAGRWVEHRISWYRAPGRFDLTLGHRPGASRDAPAALGIPQPDEAIRACFGCHSTASSALDVVQPGVQCARCHAASDAHAKIPDNEVCAECHRNTPPGGNWDDPLNIRFQPLRLAMSRCVQGGAIPCSGCHAAHDDTAPAPATVRAQCVSCHAKPHREGDCAACHMPKSSPAPYLTFTDHRIQVRR